MKPQPPRQCVPSSDDQCGTAQENVNQTCASYACVQGSMLAHINMTLSRLWHLTFFSKLPPAMKTKITIDFSPHHQPDSPL